MPEFDPLLRSLIQILYFTFIYFLLFSKIIWERRGGGGGGGEREKEVPTGIGEGGRDGLDRPVLFGLVG